MPMNTLRIFVVALGLAGGITLVQSAPLMIVGNDEKLLWDDQFKPVLSPPGQAANLDLSDVGNLLAVDASTERKPLRW